MTLSAKYVFCPYDAERLVAKPRRNRGLPTCPRCSFIDYQNPKPCVAVLLTRGNKLLLARRGVDPQIGKWDIPGGFIEPGESAEMAVIRETEEETTLRIKLLEFLGSVPDVYGSTQVPTINFCFAAAAAGGRPRAKSDVAELKWFESKAIQEEVMAFAHQAQIIRWWRRWSARNGVKLR